MKRFLAPLAPYKGKVIFLILWGILNGTQGTVVALAMKYMIDAVSAGNYNNIFVRLGIIGAMFFVIDIFSYFVRNLDNKIQWEMDSTIRKEYLGRYIRGDNNKFESLGTGRINNIINQGIDAWTRIVGNIHALGGQLIVGIIVGFAVVGVNLGWLGFIAFTAAFILSFAFVQFANKKLAVYRKERRDEGTEIDRNTTRIVMSKFEILQNNRFGQEEKKIQQSFSKLFTVWLKESKTMVVTFDLQKIIFTIIRIVLIGYILMHISDGRYTIGDMALFWMLLNQIYSNIQGINNWITAIHRDNVYIQKLWEVFDTIPPMPGYSDGRKLNLTKGDISLNNVTYDYGKGAVIKDFSLNIIGGMKTALVGVSGGGKSTIVKLIAGYVHPQNGEILIDGQALPNNNNTDYVSLKSYYDHIGYLTQEPNVFDGTIYENLVYALDHEPTTERLEQAIQGAQCQFIHEFPDGVQTEIGEKGIKLSGGQRQRLAIAKVMLKNPDIIILDEPTSALDSFSEEDVTKAFNNLFEGKTVIIIAHRLQTVKAADRIIVLDHGKVVEEGNHDSLVKSGGVYAKMLELQSGF